MTLEAERQSLSQLREELTTTANEAERLVRALDQLEMLAPLLPRPGEARPAVRSVRPKRRNNA